MGKTDQKTATNPRGLDSTTYQPFPSRRVNDRSDLIVNVGIRAVALRFIELEMHQRLAEMVA